MRLDRRWGPLGVVPIKLAVFLPAAVLDLGGLLSNRSGTTPAEASVAAVAMSALVAIMTVFIFFERGVALPATHAEGRRVRVVACSPSSESGALGVRPGGGD